MSCGDHRRWARHLLPVLIAAAALFVLGVREQTGAQTRSSIRDAAQPNILWILAEDMGPDLGADGTPEARTPNLDRLAARGMRFTNAFTTAPVCSPSRSALMTGMYQTSIGAHNHRSHRPEDPSAYPFPLPDGVRLISDWLQEAGYATANIVHFPEGTGFRGTGKTDWNFSYEGKPFDVDRWADLKRRQPFYAQINFPETHRGKEWDEAHEHVTRPADPKKVRIPPYYPDHPVVRQDWAQYLNAVMALDRKVGVVLDLLEREGLAERTVVIFMGDNGRAMLRGKQWPYDSGLHVPLVIYWPTGIPAPERYRAGTVSDQLISSIDVTATTLAIAGAEKPVKMQGRIFLGRNADQPRDLLFGGRDRGDETVDRIRTVRSERYRYIRNNYPERPFLQTNRYKEVNYPAIWVMRKLHQEGKLTPVQARLLALTRPREELYDLRRDPYETVNLAGSPAFRKPLVELRTALDRWIEETDDQGRIPEGPAVAKYYEQRARERSDERINELRAKWGVR
ncbi:MAG: sulfatase family protein [Vicinamibacteraceae bacterium]